MIKEEWKKIEGYKNYLISNLGKIMSKSRKTKTIRNNKPFTQSCKEKILSSGRGKNGYKIIRLYENMRFRTFSIHRLVAKFFLPNPENKNEVNHKNGNKTDNRVDNLEWVTKSENTIHAYENNLMPRYKGCTLHGRNLKNGNKI